MMVQMEGIKKQYEDFCLQCSMEVEENRITGLVGPNGAGKTTLFKILLGLTLPEEGSVQIFGKKAGDFTKEEKKRIGVVLADSSFNHYLSIVEIARISQEMYEKFSAEEFLKQCRQFALPIKAQIKTFSTGMMAKLKIIYAISHGAELLILDEPTAGLDVVARDGILELLRTYMEVEGRSVLISSHISSDLEGLCDDIYLIHKGEIVLHEETDALISEYGMLKVTAEQYQKLEKKYLIRVKKEPFGYSCLTNEKQFYLENYPDIAIEKGSIDDVILMTIRGERL